MTQGRFVHHYLGYLLGQANHALFKDFEPAVREAGLTSIEWRVLATLHDGAPLAVSDLAREVLSKQPTVTKLVQRMALEGWLVLQADPADQRRTLVAATSAGKRIARSLVLKAKAQEASVLRRFSAIEVVAFKELLEKLASAPVDQTEPSSPPVGAGAPRA